MFASVYRSQATISFDEMSLLALANQAGEFNKEHQITGFLKFEQDHFLQYLEGDESSVRALMTKISHDYRHTILRRIDLEDIPERTFEGWTILNTPHQKVRLLNLVYLLEDVLSFMDDTHYDRAYIQQRVIRLVNRLSQHPIQYF